jgi:hypothetical protein
MVIDQVSDGGAVKVFYKLYNTFSLKYKIDIFTIL